MFLNLGALPAFAAVPIANPIVQEVFSTDQLVQQGTQFYEASQFAAAVTVWQQAASAFKAEGDILNQAMALSNLSLTYQQLGQWPQATQAITESLNLLGFKPQGMQTKPNKNTSKEHLKILAQSLGIQGRLELSQGQAEKALKTWQEAASIYTQVGDDAGVISSQIYQAQVLQSQGLYRRALQTLQQVRSSLNSQVDSPVKSTGLRSLGNALRLVGDLDESRKVLEQSLAVAKSSQSSQDTGATLLSLGNIAKAQQNTQAALAYYQEATTSSSKITKIQAQLNQLSLLLETQQDSVASGLWPQIQSQLSDLASSRAAVEARINLAGNLLKLGSRKWGSGSKEDSTPTPQDVAQLLATAVQEAKSLGDHRVHSYALGQMGRLYEVTQQHSEAIALTQQALLLAQSLNASDIAYRWQWQLGRLLKVQGENKGANATASRASAIAAYETAVKTLQSLRSDLVAINPDVQFSFRESVEPVYRELVDLLLQSQGTSQPSQENLQKARQTIEALQLAELDDFFREACLTAKPEEIDCMVDQQALTAAVIYPIILKDRLEIILKLPNQALRHYTAPVPQSEVENTLEKLRRQLTQPYALKEVKSLSQQVYSWLIKPALADLAQSDIKTLVFVLDGSLRNIPMAALYDGKQYLVENYSVALAPGLQLIEPKPLRRRQLKALVAGVTEPRHGFAALPNVKNELDEIQSEVTGQVLFNQQFTSQSLQNQIHSLPFPVVHLATHGQFSSKPEKTFIIAWDAPILVKDLSNFLQSRDQTQPNNAIELLVLSACQTATGDKRAALGLAGVAVRAGARSTLASLWNVNDESTALVMIQFYRELINNQLTKAEALRQAQLVLLKNPSYQHPMFWAPYVLLGNWL
jgi:CHAT domain-containing protein